MPQRCPPSMKACVWYEVSTHHDLSLHGDTEEDDEIENKDGPEHRNIED